MSEGGRIGGGGGGGRGVSEGGRIELLKISNT